MVPFVRPTDHKRTAFRRLEERGGMKRLVVTGGSGLLGSAVARRAAPEYDVVATYHTRPVSFAGVECIELDLTDPEDTRVLETVEPDAVIHCAALTDVDECERRPERARRYNVDMATGVAEMAESLGARFVQISTDAVFDGREGRYTERDTPSPRNVYGETKLSGECAVRRTLDDHVVVRTNFFGWNATTGQSLAEWGLSRLRRGEEVPAFGDAHFSPTYTGHLAECLLELVEHDFCGVLHVAGRDRCSKLEFARELARVFELEESLVVPSSMDDADFDARRGRDLSLSVEKARSVLQSRLPTAREGLVAMRRDEP